MVSFWSPQAQAAVPPAQCLDGLTADHIEPAGNTRPCWVIRQFEPATANIHPRMLVVFLAGDRHRGGEPANDRGTGFNLSQQLSASALSLRLEDDRSGTLPPAGWQDGSYTPGQVAALASALDRLRVLHGNKKILLVGHSGGAAMAALLAGRFPASADAYLLAGCPCDAMQWRQWRDASTAKPGRWTNSLSPLDEVEKIPASTRIALVVGSKDDYTLAKFSEAYVSRLQRQGVKTRLTYAIGATHVSVLRAPEFFMLAQQLAAEIAR